MATLKELLNSELSDTFTDLQNITENVRKSKLVLERPSEEVKLFSVSKESVEITKTQKDPTDDLIFLPIAASKGELLTLSLPEQGFLIFAKDTQECWIAPDQICLNKNFIYREDLEIMSYTSLGDCLDRYLDINKDYLPGVYPTRKCYILNNPANETYEVYYASNYPAEKYGKSTPQGMCVHMYPNRFHRDMAIIALDKLYSNSSNKEAGKLTARTFEPNEAIIISDGAYMKNSCASSVVYLDKSSVIKCTKGFLPSDEDQAVLVSEVTGAIIALKMCLLNKKKKITYYYDNTSIVNVFKNKKTEYLSEIKEYKELLKEMDSKGFKINFIELHPKTGDNRDNENKALMFFHNNCDSECRIMCDIFKKDYKSFTTTNYQESESYKDISAYIPKNKYKAYNKEKKSK